MPVRKLLVCLALLALIAAGCSNDLSQTVAPAPSASPTPTPTAQPTPTPTATLEATPESAPTLQPTPPPTPTATIPEPIGPASGVGDSFYPLMGNGGYDVLHYDINLDIEPSENTIDAVTTLTAIATEHLDQFNLDLLGLEVEAVSVNGANADFTRDGQELTILPLEPVSSGTQFFVDVNYSGSPQPVDDPGYPWGAIGWHSNEGVIYTDNQPSGAMGWYPSNNHPTDKATFRFEITVPEGTTAAATGLLVAETTAEGRTTTTWLMDDPMATYLAAVYVGDFERHEQRLDDGLLIRDYVPRGSDPSTLEQLAVATEAIRYFEEFLGPYPFDAYGTIVMPFDLGYALENQTLSLHGPDGIFPYIIAHEVVHQWIGNSVTLDDWSEIWLHEGFAHYLGNLFDADRSGHSIDDVMAEEHSQILEEGASPPGTIEVHQIFDGNTVYSRGALVMYALHRHVGDEAFFDILRIFYDQTAGGTTNTETFLSIVNDFAGPEAVAVVELWLYEPEMPPLPSVVGDAA